MVFVALDQIHHAQGVIGRGNRTLQTQQDGEESPSGSLVRGPKVLSWLEVRAAEAVGRHAAADVARRLALRVVDVFGEAGCSECNSSDRDIVDGNIQRKIPL